MPFSKKEVQKEDLNLIIFELLKRGLNPSRISFKLNISKTKVQYYIGKFIKLGLINKVGYGTWEVKTSSNATLGDLAVEVRGHGFAFKIILKDLKNWNKKKELLEKRNITFKEINNGILRIYYNNCKIWLCNSSIIVYFPQDRSYYAQSSELSREMAKNDFKLITNGLFRYLGINLEKFEYCIIKHHYSLIENPLAKDYNRKKQKLLLEMKGVVWGKIDNSLNLNEFETISKSADKDNKIVQGFFNDLKDNNPPTNSQLAVLVQGVTQNQVMFDKNFQSHLDILKKLGEAVDRLSEKVNQLSLKND